MDANGVEQTANRRGPIAIADDPAKRPRKNRHARLKQQLQDLRKGGNGKGGEKRPLAIEDIPDKPKKKGKGKGKEGKEGKRPPAYPEGAAQESKSGVRLCIAYNRGKCTYDNCRFVHLCWWCGQEHAGGDTKSCGN